MQIDPNRSWHRSDPAETIAAIHELKDYPHLERLEMQSKKIGDDVASHIAKVVLSSCTNLKSLDLHCCDIRDRGAIDLGDNLESSNLEELILTGNQHIGNEGVTHIAKALRTNTKLRRLSLDFIHNGFDDGGVRQLALALKLNSTLRRLDIGSIRLSSSGAAHISDIFRIDDFQSNPNTTLKELSFVYSKLGDIGAFFIATDIISTNASLKQLHLDECEICDRGVAEIAKGLKLNTNLEYLSLSNNAFGFEGATHLSTTLCYNATLKSLNLGDNDVGDQGATAIASALVSNSTLTELILYGNNIGPDGGTALAQSLQSNSTLKTLNLFYNLIGSTGCTQLADAICINSTLTLLDIDSNQLSFESTSYLTAALECNPSITSLVIKSYDSSQDNQISKINNTNIKTWTTRNITNEINRTAILFDLLLNHTQLMSQTSCFSSDE